MGRSYVLLGRSYALMGRSYLLFARSYRSFNRLRLMDKLTKITLKHRQLPIILFRLSSPRSPAPLLPGSLSRRRLLLRIALVVELQQAGKHLPAGRFADGVAEALRRFVEAVAEGQVLPAVGGGDRVVHFHVQAAQVGDVLGRFGRVVEAVVSGGESFLVIKHDLAAVFIISFASVFEMRNGR